MCGKLVHLPDVFFCLFGFFIRKKQCGKITLYGTNFFKLCLTFFV